MMAMLLSSLIIKFLTRADTYVPTTPLLTLKRGALGRTFGRLAPTFVLELTPLVNDSASYPMVSDKTPGNNQDTRSADAC
jgi:hypothetical protein